MKKIKPDTEVVVPKRPNCFATGLLTTLIVASFVLAFAAIGQYLSKQPTYEEGHCFRNFENEDTYAKLLIEPGTKAFYLYAAPTDTDGDIEGDRVRPLAVFKIYYPIEVDCREFELAYGWARNKTYLNEERAYGRAWRNRALEAEEKLAKKR